jgi:hypothetical protein
MKSISKIRHIQESNRILENRLLNEQSTTGATPSIFDKLPQSCKDMINNKDEVNSFYGRCSSELMKGEFYKTTDMMDKVDAALNCVSKKLRG